MSFNRTVLCGFVALGLCLALVTAAQADRIWDLAGDGNWNVAVNWSGDAVPLNEKATVGNGFTAEVTTNVLNVTVVAIDNGSTVHLNNALADLRATGGALDIEIGVTDNQIGNLLLDAGIVHCNDDFKIGYYGDGFMTQTGGTASSGDDFYIAEKANSTGTFTLIDGIVNVGDDLKVGGYGTALLDMRGGQINLPSGYVSMGNHVGSNGTFQISGGTLLQAGGTGTDRKFSVGDEDTGVFRVIGDAASINILDYIQTAAFGTLEVVLKDGGISTINAETMTLAGALNVTLDAGFTPTAGDYDLIVAGTGTGTFDAVTLPPGNWSLSYPTGSEIVRLTYIPEPSSIVLAIMGLLGLLAYAARKRSNMGGKVQ